MGPVPHDRSATICGGPSDRDHDILAWCHQCPPQFAAGASRAFLTRCCCSSRLPVTCDDVLAVPRILVPAELHTRAWGVCEDVGVGHSQRSQSEAFTVCSVPSVHTSRGQCPPFEALDFPIAKPQTLQCHDRLLKTKYL